MTVLIDEARWWWRGRKWCHLVSDESYAELHAFADRTGIPRRGFQGDHYDIPEEFRAELIEAGAVEVGSRELLRRLRAAGLRQTAAERRARAAGGAATPIGGDSPTDGGPPTGGHSPIGDSPIGGDSLTDGGPPTGGGARAGR